jgi:putative tricarboxylic transport membrane protein
VPPTSARLTTDRVGGGGLGLLALGVLWESRALPVGTWREPGPAAVPMGLALVALALGVALVARGGSAPALGGVGWSEAPRALVVVAALAFLALAFERLGYRLSVFAAVLFLVAAVERRPPLAALVYAAGMAWGSFFLFNSLLKVPLPRGPFGF